MDLGGGGQRRQLADTTFGSSKPNMSRMPMKPSVACLTALLSAAIDFELFDPAVPTVDACWLATSAWLWTDSFELEERVPKVEPSLFKLFARLTMVATVRQYRALARESLVVFDWKRRELRRPFDSEAEICLAYLPYSRRRPSSPLAPC